MDALAQLALMSKAKMVFENPETFLSFPALSPIGYKADQLKFDPANMTRNLPVLAEFSRIANACPTGTIYPIELEPFFWDAYSEILSNAILARDLAPAEDIAAYNAAVALLTTTDADGLTSDSIQMSTYRQYRDASIKATEDYKNFQLTAESSNDPEVRNRWVQIDEPQLRELNHQAEENWRTKGFKEEIERAQQIQQAHAARSPQSTWHQWTTLFEPNLDFLTTATIEQFVPTSYAPQGIFDLDWPTFHLTRAEINQLAQQAPPELRNIFATEGSTSEVEALSFEYRSVALTRPWFKSAVFDARFWRLPSGVADLSDGGKPPQGRWPAYASALIFVRNISLTLRTNSTNPTVPATPIRTASVLAVDRAMVRPTILVKPAGGFRPALQLPRGTSPVTATNFRVRPRPTISLPPKATQPATNAHPIIANTSIFSRMNRNDFEILRGPSSPRTLPPPPPPPPPSPSSPTITQQGTRDDISILAFICKRLPKSPNPDPTLAW